MVKWLNELLYIHFSSMCNITKRLFGGSSWKRGGTRSTNRKGKPKMEGKGAGEPRTWALVTHTRVCLPPNPPWVHDRTCPHGWLLCLFLHIHPSEPPGSINVLFLFQQNHTYISLFKQHPIDDEWYSCLCHLYVKLERKKAWSPRGNDIAISRKCIQKRQMSYNASSYCIMVESHHMVHKSWSSW